MPHAAYVLAGLLLLVSTARAQQPSPSPLDVAATMFKVRIEVELTGHLQLSGVRAERVRVEATSPTAGDLPGCPVSLQQDGDIVEISMSPSGGCTGKVDLQVYMPRRFDATIVAPKAREVVVRDLDGRVTGEVNPNLECHFRSFQGSSSCAGGQFDVRFSRGEFAMRARGQE